MSLTRTITRNAPGIWNPQAFEFFDFWWSNSHRPVPKSCSNAPHVRPTGWANAPPLGHIFLPLTGQDRFKTICYKYQLAFFILKLDKGLCYLHWKSVPEFLQPIFGQAFGHQCNILSAKSLSIFSSLVMYGQIPDLQQLGVKFPTPADVPKSNSLLPGKGRVSNACGMLRGGRAGGWGGCWGYKLIGA